MKPTIIVKHANLQGGLDFLDYIELPRLPYDFRRLRTLLENNIQEYENWLFTQSQQSKASREELEDRRLIIEIVKEKNHSYLFQKATQEVEYINKNES